MTNEWSICLAIYDIEFDKIEDNDWIWLFNAMNNTDNYFCGIAYYTNGGNKSFIVIHEI